jgi:hypothetical protein
MSELLGEKHGNHYAIDSIDRIEWASELCDSLDSESIKPANITPELREKINRLTQQLIELYDPDHWMRAS